MSTALIATVALLQIRAEHEATVLSKVLNLRDAEAQGGGDAGTKTEPESK